MTEPTLFLDGKVALYEGDNLPILKQFPDNHFDAVCCDPPYGISFMGRADWDGAGPDQRAFQRLFWREVRRVLKPGGHLLAFGAARTYHRLAVAIEDAGFEIRDALWELIEAEAAVQTFLASLDASQADALRRLCENAGFGGILGWVFGTGFPKGGDLAKAIDKHLGVKGTLGPAKSAAHAEWIARGAMRGEGGHDGYQRPWMDDPEAVEANARQYIGGCEASRAWEGFHPALGPALEPICLARKPLEGTLAANVLKWGCGALNIDACRIEGAKPDTTRGAVGQNAAYGALGAQGRIVDDGRGRYPKHLIWDGSDEVAAAFEAFGERSSGSRKAGSYQPLGMYGNAIGTAGARPAGMERDMPELAGSTGSASRFFYSAKADDEDRIGLEHPTIKPIDPIRWTCRLVVRPGGLVLDPFAGSGTTGEAAFREGMRAVLIERDPKHCAMIARRMEYAVSTLDARRTAARRAKAERREASGAAPKPSNALDLFA